MTYLLTLGASFPFSRSVGLSWLLNLIETRHVYLWRLQHWNYIQNYIQITSVMPKPVYLMTVQEDHKEYNSLMDQIRATYEQLDLGKYGSVDTQHLKLKPVNWLIYLLGWANFARNWTCHLQRNYTGPQFSNTEDPFQIKITLGRQVV